MAEGVVVQLSNDSFEQEVVKCHLPVLVDFRADWCMPCDLVSAAIDEIADEYAGRLKVGRVDVDHNRDTAVKYSVNPLPTILLFRGGDVIKEFVGVKEKQDFEAVLRATLG